MGKSRFSFFCFFIQFAYKKSKNSSTLAGVLTGRNFYIDSTIKKMASYFLVVRGRYL
jgi:hypothetical protein